MNSSDCICCPIEMKIGKTNEVNMNIQKTSNIDFNLGNRCCSVPSYNVLPDKPQINGVTLQGNKLDSDLYLQHEMDEITFQEIDNIIYG